VDPVRQVFFCGPLLSFTHFWDKIISNTAHIQKLQENQMNMSRSTLKFGIWVNVFGIALALGYAVSLIAVGSSGTGFPPIEPYDTAISIISLISAPAILIFFAVIHTYAPEDRKIFSLPAFAFSILFTAMTCINRFVHLAVIRPSLAAGATDGLEWFTPYGAHSIMVGLEILGWSFFLGLAFLFAAFVFKGGLLEKTLFGVFLADAVLCLVSTLTPFTGITLFTFIGTIAWGPGFIIACALLIRLFRRELTQSERWMDQATTASDLI
jgi:hypothetical protein